MSYAVIVTGGRQYRVMEGETLRVEKIEGDIDSEVKFDQVLLHHMKQQGHRQHYTEIQITGINAGDNK